MRIAVIGAGIAGLTAARRLAIAGHACHVYERWPGLGGQVATLDIGEGDPLERYYHHLFTSDREIVALYEELGMDEAVEWLPSSVAMFADGVLYPFTTPVDLLRFRPLPLLSRLRMGLAVVMLQRRHRSVEPFEQMTAKDWICRAMGKPAWDRVWGPLLQAKFGRRSPDISMAWLWSKLTLRRQVSGDEARKELLGYPRGGWQPLLERLAAEVAERGGRVLIDRPAARLEFGTGGALELTPGASDSFRRGHDPRAFDSRGPRENYDTVLVTTPSDIFRGLLSEEVADSLGREYLGKVDAAEYHAAACLLLEIDRQFSPYYWTNIADPSLPFIGLIEHTNLVEPARYGGRRFLYVANYVDETDPLLNLGADDLLQHYEEGLRAVNPSYSRAWVKERWLFREPAAQPIVTTGYRECIPAHRTPVPGLYLANTTQIYPEDRGTNYSVRLGEDAARIILADLNAAASSSSSSP